ncbi:MAG: DEAD/DEAH box helicase, partial [archaeon]|nr:DEAD/DEAH box helicase [archaeon]
LPIQVLAIEAGLLKKKKNLLVVSSTSSGKTMLGELTGFNKIIVDKLSKNPIPSDILKLKGDLRKEKLKIFNRKLSKIRSNSKMLYLVPIVALANLRYEEYKILKNFGITPALKVGKSFMDDDLPNEFGSMEKADLIIGTYEAIDVILRSGGKNSLGNVETIVIDEIQMLNDVDRGWVLDGLIARIRYLYPNAQLILLSATISDPKLLSDHYKCQLIEFNGRPVPMERHLILFLSDFEKQKALLYLVEDEFKKKSKYGYKGQSLIFTNSRRKCHAISDFLYNNRISAAAYHSGLTHQDRRKIEKKFSKQHISCVVTTAALAAGVDFPASQVIFESLSMGIKNLTVAEFEQMSGRAGRYLKHEQAKVIILCQPGKVSHSSQLETEEKVAFRLLKGKIESIQLEPENINMYTEVLAFISMISRSKANSKKKPGTKNDIRHFQNNMLNNDFSLDSCLKYLQSNNFLRIGKNRSNGSLEFYTTPFGKASASSFFKVDICLKIKKCLEEGKNLFDLKEEEENGIEYEDGEIEDENLKEKNKKIDNKNSKNLIDTNLAVSMAFDLHPFKNIYVSNSVLKEISSKSGGQKSSSLLFSNSTLSLLSADSLSKNRKSRLSRFITDLLLIWTHDIFNCECKESPYCNCGKINVQKRILQLRLEGKYPNEIQKWLKKNWNIKIFSGDLIDFFDGLIYILRSIYKIGKNITISDDIKENLDEIPNLLNFFKLR